MHIIVGQPRTFGMLRAQEDNVYILDPNSGDIVESKIRAIKELRRQGGVAILEVKIYKIVALESVTEDKLENANKEYNTKIDWTFRVMNHTTLGPVKFKALGVPTIISADKKELERWMVKTGPRKK